jgi:hypothetical protein
LLQLAAPPPEIFPAAQLLHPVCCPLECWPASQSRQLLAPLLLEYCPPVQASHLMCDGFEILPAVHEMQLLAPLPEYCPPAQSLQPMWLPLTYLPASQF